VSGLGVFNGDKLVGWLNEKESKGFNFFMGDITSSIIPVSYGEDKKVSVEINNVKTQYKFKLVNNKPTVDVTVKMKAFIAGLEMGLKDLSKKDVKEIQIRSSEIVQKEMASCLQKAQNEFNTDFLKIAALIYRKDTKYWLKISNTYEEQLFKEIQIKVKVDTIITNAAF